MPIDTKQFEEFSKSLKDAVTLFRAQQDEITGLKGTVADLEKRVITLKAQGFQFPQARQHGYGFHDADSAKEFINLVKGVYLRDPMVKDLTEGVDSEGGYLVQPEYRNTMLSLIEQYGIARQRCTILPMMKDELTMPKLTGGVQVYWIGEGKTITQTQPSFGEFKLAVKKLAALVPITSELLDDTSVAIANLLATLFAQAIAKEEDRLVLTGDVAGASDPYNGVLNDPDVQTYTLDTGEDAFTDITADHLANVIAQLSPVEIDGAQWYMHRTVFNLIRRLKSSADEHYIYAEPGAPGEPGTIWGYPYTLTETMPGLTASAASTPFIFFGNLRHYYIGDRKMMSIARSDHVGFAQDKVFLRVIQREALGYALPETGVAVTTAA